MKRILVRLAVLSGVVVLGLIAIAQAQRAFEPPAAQAPGTLPVASSDAAAPKPIPLMAGEDNAPTSRDPFAAGSVRRTALQTEAQTLPDRYADDRYTASPDAPARANLEAAAPDDIPPARQLAPADPQEPRGFRLKGEVPSARAGDPFGPRAQGATAADNRIDAGEAPPPFENTTSSVPGAAPGADANDNFAPPRTAGRYVQPIDSPATAPAAALDDGPAPPRSPSDKRIVPVAETDSAAIEGTGRPGAEQLEGVQAPTVTIEKTAPAEIQVGKPATFTIRVRNTGSVVAHGVEIHDQVPKGTQLVDTTPRASRSPQGGLVFDIGALKPGDEATAQVQLMPLAEGEIGSLASVQFRAEASVRTVATKPELRVELSAPSKVMIGASVPLKIKVTNPGSGAATGVVLAEKLPPGLKHTAGDELEFEVGVLKPGESRELELTLTAAAAGPVTNTLVARGDANLKAEHSINLEVIAPALKVGMTGPKRRYLERAATYNISVSNPGTAPAKDIELVSTLPKGLKFVEANNAGQYDAATHSVYWSLEELPPQETGTVSLTALPIEPGELKLHIKGQARQGLTDQQEETITVDGLAAVQFELVDVNDPIEVNGQTTYEIRVTNSGSKAATNLRVVVLLPPEIKPLSAEGPARHVIDGQRVLFDPVRQLAPKADTTFTVKAQGLQPGDLRVRVQIVADEITTPITKEESTRVYADE